MSFSSFDYVEVVLYDDGTYEVKDVDYFRISPHFSDKRNGRNVDIFYCNKETWKFEWKWKFKWKNEKNVRKNERTRPIERN